MKVTDGEGEIATGSIFGGQVRLIFTRLQTTAFGDSQNRVIAEAESALRKLDTTVAIPKK